MPKDLAALREVLLAPEQASIEQLQHRLDDPATRAAELAESLPAALALASTDSATLTEHLRPLVREALAETLRLQPDLLATSCRHALRQTFRNPVTAAGRTLCRLFRRRRKNAVAPRIEQLYLVRRSDGILLQHVEHVPSLNDPANDSPAAQQDPLDEDYQRDQRTTRSMAMYLLATFRDPELLTRYALLKTLRIERYLYGFHADEYHLLLSVILAGRDLPLELLAQCDGILAGVAADGGASGGSPLPALPLPVGGETAS
jgi:hypothetical protein